jgi:hypothetical protein
MAKCHSHIPGANVGRVRATLEDSQVELERSLHHEQRFQIGSILHGEVPNGFVRVLLSRLAYAHYREGKCFTKSFCMLVNLVLDGIDLM